MFLLTGLITALHFLAIYPLFFLMGIVLFFFARPSSKADKSSILAHWEVLFLNFLIWLCVFGTKCLVNKAHKVFKAGKYQKCRNDILIGLGFIAIFALFAADRLPEMSTSNETNWNNLFAPVSLISALYVFFIVDSSTHCNWNTKNPSFEFVFGIIFILAIHTYRFFSGNFYVVQFYKNSDYLQISFSFVLMSSTLEIYAILMGKLVLLDNEKEVSLEAVVVIPMAPVRMDVGTQCDASEYDEEVESVSGSDDDEEEEYTSSSENEENEDSRSIIYIDFEIECEPRDDDLEEQEHVICMVCDGPPGW